MQNQSFNPLTKYFRQPAIYLKLPSQGQWWGHNALEMPANQEIPIYPMSTKDEILLKTPDALLNGQGIVDVIQSCCPAIKNAWLMPSVDVDAILISIRIATYGNKMIFNSSCPHCENKNEHQTDLGALLSDIVCPNFDHIVEYKDLKIKLRPQYYASMNKQSMIKFHEDKIVMALNDSNLDPDTKAAQLSQAVNNLVDIGIIGCTDSTDYIELTNGDRVSDSDHLYEFYKNSESGIIKVIQQRIDSLSQQAQKDFLVCKCESCSKEYKTNLIFDYANFFDKGF